jgi:hypothetical protein
MHDPSGAQVFWDYQIGTFTGILGQLTVGRAGGDILTVAKLETLLGVSLSADTGARLQEDMLAHPYAGNKRFVSKLQFMDLFKPSDLARIYAMSRNTNPDYAQLSIGVQIELDRVNRAPNDQIELSDARTLAGLQSMQTYGLITEPGGAERISKGIPYGSNL